MKTVVNKKGTVHEVVMSYYDESIPFDKIKFPTSTGFKYFRTYYGETLEFDSEGK